MKVSRIDLSKYEKPSRFIKWKQGDNRVRVVTEPYMYQVVGKRTANGFVRQVLEDGVEVAEFLKDATPKLTYGFVVFSFETEHFQVIETGVMLGHALTELVKSKYPEEYKTQDIIIKVSGEKLKRKYSVEWAKDSKQLPEGVSRHSAEYKYTLSYFEGL